MQWVDLQVVTGRFPELQYLFHVPNGGVRSRGEAGKLKAAGVREGVPDLFLPVPAGGFHGLCIEMKAGDDDLKPAQIRWRDFLTSQGYCHVVCWTEQQASDTLTQYLTGQIRRTADG